MISVKVATELRNMLESVTTDEGTAPAARIAGYRVAGKTGTANRYNGHGGYSGAGYTATFVGMVPADNPQLVCEVVLDRPLHNHYGGAVAAPDLPRRDELRAADAEDRPDLHEAAQSQADLVRLGSVPRDA